MTNFKHLLESKFENYQISIESNLINLYDKKNHVTKILKHVGLDKK